MVQEPPSFAPGAGMSSRAATSPRTQQNLLAQHVSACTPQAKSLQQEVWQEIQSRLTATSTSCQHPDEVNDVRVEVASRVRLSRKLSPWHSRFGLLHRNRRRLRQLRMGRPQNLRLVAQQVHAHHFLQQASVLPKQQVKAHRQRKVMPAVREVCSLFLKPNPRPSYQTLKTLAPSDPQPPV